MIIVVVVVLVLAGLVAAATVPTSHPFSGQINSVGLFGVRSGIGSLDPPSGCQVKGSWHTLSGDVVTFNILSADEQGVYLIVSASGSFNFTANDGPYMIVVDSASNETIDVSGNYWYPIL